MGRTRKKPLCLIVESEIRGSIGRDRVLVFGSDPDDNLLDELQCPQFDEVLIALRKAFSLSFPRNPFIEGLQEALSTRMSFVESGNGSPRFFQRYNDPLVPLNPAHYTPQQAEEFPLDPLIRAVAAESKMLVVKAQEVIA